VSDSLVCMHLIVKGRVQGVGFRDFTFRAAVKIGGLSGWVRNLDNGDVEILVQGLRSKIQELIVFCQQGPALARVDSVDQEQVQNDSALTAFRVRRD
jgi:acylphosphatase